MDVSVKPLVVDSAVVASVLMSDTVVDSESESEIPVVLSRSVVWTEPNVIPVSVISSSAVVDDTAFVVVSENNCRN